MAKTLRLESYENFKKMIDDGQLQLMNPFYKDLIIRRAKEINLQWEIVNDALVDLEFSSRSTRWLTDFKHMSPEQYRREYLGEWFVDESSNLIDKKILRDLHNSDGVVDDDKISKFLADCEKSS